MNESLEDGKPGDRDFFEWDVATWRQAIPFWSSALPGAVEGLEVLEIGARNGGLSLYFASRGCRVVCSDLGDARASARELHRRFGVDERVSYRRVDATRIDFPDNSFDLAVFKSVLGGVGGKERKDRQLQAVRELHRVLKPGGKLLYAENLQGSSLHMFLRRRFVPWGAAWRYVSFDEMREFLKPFKASRHRAFGFFSAFGRTEAQKSLMHRVDRLCAPFIPDSSKYVLVGCAEK